MINFFEMMEDKDFFKDVIRKAYTTAPTRISDIMWCNQEIDEARISFAYSEYTQEINRFKMYLHSANPDQHKRAGALLFSLYNAEIIKSLNLESTADDLESGFTRVTIGDADHNLQFVRFYEEYHNVLIAYSISLRACNLYETTPLMPTFDYIHNICRYLKSNDELSVDSLFVQFKAFFHR